MPQPTYNEVLQYCIEQPNKDQIRELWNALRSRSDTLAFRAVIEFSPGNVVKFRARGNQWTAIVLKRNQKTVSLTARMSREDLRPLKELAPSPWRCTASSLEKVPEEKIPIWVMQWKDKQRV